MDSDQLNTLTRAEIQKLCKRDGIKASGKKRNMIRALQRKHASKAGVPPLSPTPPVASPTEVGTPAQLEKAATTRGVKREILDDVDPLEIAEESIGGLSMRQALEAPQPSSSSVPCDDLHHAETAEVSPAQAQSGHLLTTAKARSLAPSPDVRGPSGRLASAEAAPKLESIPEATVDETAQDDDDTRPATPTPVRRETRDEARSESTKPQGQRPTSQHKEENLEAASIIPSDDAEAPRPASTPLAAAIPSKSAATSPAKPTTPKVAKQPLQSKHTEVPVIEAVSPAEVVVVSAAPVQAREPALDPTTIPLPNSPVQLALDPLTIPLPDSPVQLALDPLTVPLPDSPRQLALDPTTVPLPNSPVQPALDPTAVPLPDSPVQATQKRKQTRKKSKSKVKSMAPLPSLRSPAALSLQPPPFQLTPESRVDARIMRDINAELRSYAEDEARMMDMAEETERLLRAVDEEMVEVRRQLAEVRRARNIVENEFFSGFNQNSAGEVRWKPSGHYWRWLEARQKREQEPQCPEEPEESSEETEPPLPAEPSLPAEPPLPTEFPLPAEPPLPTESPLPTDADNNGASGQTDESTLALVSPKTLPKDDAVPAGKAPAEDGVCPRACPARSGPKASKADKTWQEPPSERNRS